MCLCVNTAFIKCNHKPRISQSGAWKHSFQSDHLRSTPVSCLLLIILPNHQYRSGWCLLNSYMIMSTVKIMRDNNIVAGFKRSFFPHHMLITCLCLIKKVKWHRRRRCGGKNSSNGFLTLPQVRNRAWVTTLWQLWGDTLPQIQKAFKSLCYSVRGLSGWWLSAMMMDDGVLHAQP